MKIGGPGIAGMFAAITVAFVGIGAAVGVTIVNSNTQGNNQNVLSSTESRMRSVEDVSNDLNFYD